jgi:uncharacterized protein YbjT (DUF2867 family)
MNLIVGASGTVGSRVARQLLARGESVRAVSRDPLRLAALKQLGAVPVRGDLRATDWLASALDGVRAVVLSTHGLVPPTRDNHPGITDDLGNRQIIDAAVKAGVEHIVFISATSGARSPALFGQVKYRAEQYLRGASGVAHTIIRPTVFIETHGLLLMAEPLRAKGSVLLFGRGETRLNWISADDVADYIVNALHASELRNCTRSIGGPDTFSRLEVLSIIEHELGRTARRRHVPVPVMRVLRTLTGGFHPGLRYLLDMAVAESTVPEDPGWAPARYDWVGRATVRDVIRRWASK